jgi:hypothetical protein
MRGNRHADRCGLHVRVGPVRYAWTVDIEALYEMTASAARNAERMCGQEGGTGTGLPFQSYAGYPFYVDEYNSTLMSTTALPGSRWRRNRRPWNYFSL